MKCYYIPSIFWINLVKSLFTNEQLEEFIICDNFAISGSFALAAMNLDVIYFANTSLKFITLTVQMISNILLIFFVIIKEVMRFTNGFKQWMIMPGLSWMKRRYYYLLVILNY